MRRMPRSRRPAAPRLLLFAYGSLMIPKSASRALGRVVTSADMTPAILKDYQRCWRVRVPIWSSELESDVAGLFLDVCPAPGRYVNGTLIGITEDELASLKVREEQYAAVDVSSAIEGRLEGQRILTFIGRPKWRRDLPGLRSFVPARYLNRIERACLLFGADFLREFRATTKPPGHDAFKGTYRFANPEQAKRV